MKNIVFAALLFLPAVRASAVQNLKLGSVAIHPFVTVQELYDSNIYLTRDNVKSSMINKSSVGLGFMNHEGVRLSLKGAYSAEFLSYSRAYRINNAVHHNADLELGYKMPGERRAAVSDSYKSTTDPANSEETARAKRQQNVLRGIFESPLKGSFGYSIDAQHTIHDYLSSDYDMLDRSEILAGASLNYKVQPKTRVFGAYHYGSLRYDKPNAITNTKTNDAVYNNFDLGVTGDLSSKLTGTVSGGCQFREYKKSLNSAADSKTTLGYGLRLSWFPDKKTEVLFYGKRANIESVYYDSRYYVSTLNYVGVTREINRFKAGLGGYYEAVRYPEATPLTGVKRRDGSLSATASLDYNVQKWLTAGAGYSYKTRSSNEHVKNYVDNVVSVQIKGMF